MNTLAKIALGTVATGAVALAAMSPVMAAPQTPAVDMAVATPTTISAPAPAYAASNTATTHTIGTKEWFPETTHTAMTRSTTNGTNVGCGIFTDVAPNHLNDF